MPNTLNAALLFLINTLFNLYLYILTLRVILVWAGANYFDPITQFIVKLTDFIVKPLRRLLPNMRSIETASLALILILQMIKFLCIVTLTFGFPNLLGILILAITDSIKIVIEIFFYAILLQAIISWLQPYSPINRVLYQITAPLLRPFQRMIPSIGGIDISPIPVLIILQLLLIVFVNPLMAMGLNIAVIR